MTSFFACREFSSPYYRDIQSTPYAHRATSLDVYHPQEFRLFHLKIKLFSYANLIFYKPMQIGHVIWFCEDDEGWGVDVGGAGGACVKVGFWFVLVLTFFLSGRSGLSCGICTLLTVTSSSSESSKLTTSLLVLAVEVDGRVIGSNGVVTWAVSRSGLTPLLNELI